MKVAERFHLTYCSNIHAGETWPEVRQAIGAALPDIRQQLGVEGPLAIGLRLSAAAASTLERREQLAEFRAFLRTGNYYVPTINGFPYGAFHGQRVKEQVYLPDWRSDERLRYTNQLASLLAALLADRADVVGSVSTVPGAFKPNARTDQDVRAIAARVLMHAAHLRALRDKTGIAITLAIEPEPACFIETVEEAIDFFTRFLFEAAAVRAVADRTDGRLTVDDVRRHIGVCFDTCHMAVEFEDAAAGIDRLHDAGIGIYKVQISSALRVRSTAGHADGWRALARFAEDTYLHQVVQRDNSHLVRYTDLPEALAAASADHSNPAREWRVHFHVPVFLPAMNEFDTTQSYIVDVLRALKRTDACRYLEVETYTWDVLPAEYRTVSLHTAVARELAWVRDQLDK